MKKAFSMVTALAPLIGYDAAAAVAHEAVATARPFGKWRGSRVRLLQSNSKKLWTRGA